jgi:hypothetical protein
MAFFRRRSARLRWFIGPILPVFQPQRDEIVLQLTDMQKVKIGIQPVDGAGNPAPIDRLPTWAIGGANPEVLTAEVSADGLSCQVVTVGPLGSAQVQVSADADLGEGIVPIAGTLDIDVVASQAVTLAVTAGVPEPK